LGSHKPQSPSINKQWSGQEFFMSPLGLHPWLNQKNMILITCWKRLNTLVSYWAFNHSYSIVQWNNQGYFLEGLPLNKWGVQS
jgi:hypothetical protein